MSPATTPELPAALATATADQPAARAALAAALAAGPSHAYLFEGPRGSGKAIAARALAGEILAIDATDPDDVRRRAGADPSPHPDLTWVRPSGNQHLVEEIRERVISASSYRPFEGERRVFVIEAAEAMAEEAQNALLKTLEEPPPFAHLLLLASEPAELLDTVISRCQPVRFMALAPEAIERLLAEAGSGPELAAVARLCGGDLAVARRLLDDEGRELRRSAEELARAARRGEPGSEARARLLAAAEEAGKAAAERAEAEIAERAESYGDEKLAKRVMRDAGAEGRRVARRYRTETLDLGLALLSASVRDLVAIAEGAPELVAAVDREHELIADAEGLDPLRARSATALIADTRRRLDVNVNEELALDALVHRLARVLGDQR